MGEDLEFMGIFRSDREGWIHRGRFYERTDLCDEQGIRIWTIGMVGNPGDKRTRTSSARLEDLRAQYLAKHLTWECLNGKV